MFKPYRLGTIAGIPIRLRASFLALLAFVFIWAGGIAGVFAVLLTFGSVVLHELGHALVARRLGVRIATIDLHFLGGAAQMVDPPRTASDEIQIAIAGPLVSLALAGVGLGLGAATGVPLLTWLGWVNLALGLFNLIPALPMDGGRVLRASLAGRLGYQRATEISVTVARVFAVLFAVAGLVLGQIQLVLLAGLVWMLGNAERRMAANTAYLEPPPPVRVYTYRW